MAKQIQQSANSWYRFWTQLGATQKTGLVGFAVIAISVLALSWINPAANSPVPLFPETKLQSVELQRLQLAFAETNLNEFQLRDGQIFVPREQRGSFLKAASECNAVPIRLQPTVDRPPSISPFVSRYQQQLQQQFQKKLAIQEMVRRLKFVADAWIEFDADGHGIDRQVRPAKCTVSIQPVDDLVLDATQIETIRNMLKGAVANLPRSEVVIVDLAAGLAYDQQLMAQDQTQFQARLIERLRLRQKLQRQIREALSAFPAVEIDVAVDEPKIDPSGTEPAASEDFRQTSSDAKSNAIKSNAMLPSFPAIPGSNGHAAVPLINPPTESNKTANSKSDRGQSTFSGCLRINLRVPQSLLATLTDSSSKSAENDQTAAFEQLKADLINRVRPLLPQDSLGAAEKLPIIVDVKRENSPNPTTSVFGFSDFLATRSGGMVVAAGSGVCLALFLCITLLRKSPINSQSANPAADANATFDPDLDLELRLQIDELLKKDPDAAASVIRSWIQKAA